MRLAVSAEFIQEQFGKNPPSQIPRWASFFQWNLQLLADTFRVARAVAV